MRNSLIGISCGLLALAGAVLPLCAQDQAPGWTGSAELSYVMTQGNTETSTLGMKANTSRKLNGSELTFRAAAVRAETTAFDRFAIGFDDDDFRVIENSDSNTSAEAYMLSGRYDRKLTERLLWYAGLGWERNRFAGIENRSVAETGLGHIWYDTETRKLRTSYALTYTDQEDVIETPDSVGTFLGARLTGEYMQKFGQATTFQSTLILDDNLDETDDFRGDWTNSLAVSMSKVLALKVSVQWLYDNVPAFQGIPLYDPKTGEQLDTVPFQLDELDTIFTTSLVLTF
ncbi:MAG: DUF481 domain-containing protein [Acidobacteria bacterium]|nr:DUF481 domain-containing protein [Acidobacteriota bacterium]